MAEYIENQPVYLGDTNTCSNDGEFVYNQLVDVTDTTQFQLRIAPCISASQLIVNPNFETDSDWTLGDNVGISDGQLCWLGETVAGSSGSYAYSTNIFITGGYYQVSITVDSISAGSLSVYAGVTELGVISSIGTHTFYGFAEPFFTLSAVILFPANDGLQCCISNVSSFEILTNFIVGVYDNTDAEVTRISYTDDPTYFTFSKDTVTISIDWSKLGITSGCHYLCVADPCVNTGGQNYPADITNGTFTGSATGWKLGSKWSYSANSVTATYSVGGDKSDYEMTQTNVFGSYTNTYCVSVECISGSGVMNVYFGETLIATQSISSGNTYEFNGLAYGNGNLKFVLLSGTFKIDNVAACTIFDTLQCDFTSNMFKIADYSSDCTLLINACNNEDGMGFVFDGSGFSPQVRLNAKLKEATYNSERQTYNNSLGKRINYYFNGRKSKTLCTDLEPEYILDFLWTLLGYDNVYIDSVAYVVDDDEFSPTWVLDNVGTIRMAVSKKTQNIKNVNCSSSESNCVISENYLLKADDSSSFVVQTNGDYILIN